MKNNVVPLQNLGQKNYFANLDGLRTLACLMVYFNHGFALSLKNLDIEGSFFHVLLKFLSNGETGVSIFFVLSGFLITFLILQEREVNGKFNIGYFYMRRVLRIWPLYFAVVTFTFLAYPVLKTVMNINTATYYNTLYYFTFLSNFDVINVHTYFNSISPLSGGITWSVAIEEQFYVVWPLLFLCVPKRYYQYIFLFVISCSLLFRYMHKDDNVVMYFHSLSVCGDLALGGLCAYFTIYKPAFRRFFSELKKPVILAIYAVGIMWVFIEVSFISQPTIKVFTRLFNTLFFAFVILEQNYAVRSVFKFSKNRFITFWGKYTYGLYLLHPVALLITEVALKIFHIDYEKSLSLSLVYGTAGLGISFILAYLSYEYFELRFLKLKDRFTLIGKRPKQVTAPKEQVRIVFPDRVFNENPN